MLKIRENTEDGEFFSLVKKCFFFFFFVFHLVTRVYDIMCLSYMNFIVRPCSPKSLCGSVAEHQSMESEGLRLDSLWKLRIFLCHMINIFLYFFTELKNLPSSLFYLQT